MAMSGTYVTEIPMKGSAEKHYKRWKSESKQVPDAIGHHVQGVTLHEGDWDSHGSIKSWNYTHEGKQEALKEKREIDDEKMAITFKGVEGHIMEQYKVYDVILQFIPKSREGCICKVTMIWEKRKEDSPEPINYMKYIKTVITDMDNHIIKGESKA